MKYVHVDAVEPGQFLGRTIFAGNGVVLLAEGVQLTVYMITTLRRIGVTMLYIKDTDFEDVEIEDVVSPQTKQMMMRQLGETLQTVRSGKEIEARGLSVSINQLLEDVLENKDVLVELTDIRTQDNDMYVHAMNVCTMATLIGISMGLGHAQLKELAIGALLHDIGRIDPLTDDTSADLRKHHTWRGFEIIKSKREFSLLIAHVAFQHREAPDGSGLPRGIEGDNIHLYAKIVAVANMYDEMLFNRETGKRLMPHEACEQMMALAGTKLDRDVLVHFLKTVSIYATGSSVRLSNNLTGVVVGQHRGLPGRPIVRIVNQDGDRDLRVNEVDLAKHTTVFIDSVLT